jgi:hypothetical protein
MRAGLRLQHVDDAGFAVRARKLVALLVGYDCSRARAATVNADEVFRAQLTLLVR